MITLTLERQEQSRAHGRLPSGDFTWASCAASRSGADHACADNYKCSNATKHVVAMPRCPDLTPAELRVMKALWQLGRSSVAEVRAELGARGQQLAYTTVMTLLGRLATKGAVIVDKMREPFLYRPAHRR
jgi:hypothetical protein